jgi:hypothetical protein
MMSIPHGREFLIPRTAVDAAGMVTYPLGNNNPPPASTLPANYGYTRRGKATGNYPFQVYPFPIRLICPCKMMSIPHGREFLIPRIAVDAAGMVTYPLGNINPPPASTLPKDPERWIGRFLNRNPNPKGFEVKIIPFAAALVKFQVYKSDLFGKKGIFI